MVTYNRFDVLLQSIRAITEQTRPVDYFVIADNCSTDGTVSKLTELDIQTDIVELKDNLGYAEGLFEGMQFALSKYRDIDLFWLMDDDSHPKQDTLSNLLNIKNKFPFQGLISVTGFIDTIWKGPVRFSNYKSKNARVKNSELHVFEVDHALIDGALIDRTVVDEVGFPDGKFFMMCEDVEYCKRIKRAGYQIFLYDKELEMTRLHYGGGGRFTRSNLWRGYYGSRNHLLILKEYFSWKALITYAIRQSKYLMASSLAKDRFYRIYLRLLGIVHGLQGKTGKTLDPKNFY